MTLNIINKNMIAHTKVELEPTINYVSASNDNFIDRLDIDNADVIHGLRSSKTLTQGVYGYPEYVTDENGNLALNDNVYNGESKIYSVNFNKFNEYESLLVSKNVIGVLDKIKQEEENITNSIDNFYNVLRILSNGQNFSDYDDTRLDKLEISNKKLMRKSVLNEAGLQRVKNEDNSFKFGVERIKCGYIIDDPGYSKKSAIKRLREYYSENLEHNNFHESNWGFKNYNSLNFFNLTNKTNTNFSQQITHKNCIVYPNLTYTDGGVTKQTYNFKDLDDFSVSFYINPRYKNSFEGDNYYHYNPGCIIDIPGVISVYIVKGNSKDENGLTDSFRILIQLGESTFTNLNTLNDNLDIDDAAAQVDGSNYLSEDGVLKYNSWHLVNLCFKKHSTNKYDFTFGIDGNTIGSVFNIEPDISQESIDNSYISIGNKYKITTRGNVSKFAIKLFSSDKDASNDNNGPYINKHILLGKETNLMTGASSSTFQDLDNEIYQDTVNYFGDNENNSSLSLGLNAEVHDIRIYKQYLDEEKCKSILESGIESIDKEKKDFGLIFYVPVYYYSQKVRKKGLVNLSTRYKFFSNNVVSDSTYNNQLTVDLENISYNYPINPVYHSFTGGTDVSVEHFCREFVSSTQPNIIISDNSTSRSRDTYGDCFVLQPSKILDNRDLNDIVKKGGTSDDLLFKVMSDEFLDQDEITASAGADRIAHQTNNILYRNYMVLPNDNGLQKQYYFKDNFNYEEEELYNIHKDVNDEIRLDIVNLEKYDNSFSTSRTFSQRRNLLTSDVNVDNKYFEIDSKVSRFVTERALVNNNFNYDGIHRFKENKDTLLNNSLSNYHSDNNLLYVLKEEADKVEKLSRYSQSYDEDSNSYVGSRLILNSRESFFGSFSNPAQRSYYSSYENAVSLSEVYDRKPITGGDIIYKKISSPLSFLGLKNYENVTTIHCISTQVFNNSIKRETFEIKDVDLPLSSGIQLTFKDTRLGTLHRADSLTKHAEWGVCGGVLYEEGVSMLHHPACWGFGKTNISIKSKTRSSTNIFELNLPAQSGETNKTKNTSKIDDLKLDESAFNSDEDFVYITDIDLHDENLNVVASAKLAQPFAKKDSDNVLFRIKMDY